MDIQIVKYVKQILQKTYNTFYYIVKHSLLIGNMSQDYKDNTKKAEFLLFNNEIKLNNNN